MDQEVKPQFEELQRDKENFEKFTELESQIEEKQRLATAFGFY